VTTLEVPSGLLIGERWRPGAGEVLRSCRPHDDSVVWEGAAGSVAQAFEAVDVASRSAPGWRAIGLEERCRIVTRFGELVQERRAALAELVSRETGKPLWDADGEIAALLGKAAVSMDALIQRAGATSRTMGTGNLETTHRPHGPMAVLGPFNFPLLLPGGHMIPALLAGNTVVFKPSDSTPACAAATVRLWQEAGVPSGVVNLVHGGVDVANALMDHPRTRGVLFTGGTAAGSAIRRRLADRPEVITALELGGNNPLVVWDVSDPLVAARLVARSAFISSGQRCLCTRRLVVSDDDRGRAVVDLVVDLADRLRTGDPLASPAPFNGSLINAGAASRVLDAQEELHRAGAEVLRPSRRPAEMSAAYLEPGVLDVTDVAARPDREVFGPLLSVVRVSTFDEALQESNNTRFGLAAGLISDHETLFEQFRHEVEAGLINFNTSTVAASGFAPFGGSGWSGNHRPSGFYAADYCAWPTATVRESIPRDDAVLHGVDDSMPT